MEGLDKIAVWPMRGGMVLLKSDVQGEIVRASENHSQWWAAHFKELKVWSPNLVAKTRTL